MLLRRTSDYIVPAISYAEIQGMEEPRVMSGKCISLLSASVISKNKIPFLTTTSTIPQNEATTVMTSSLVLIDQHSPFNPPLAMQRERFPQTSSGVRFDDRHIIEFSGNVGASHNKR